MSTTKRRKINESPGESILLNLGLTGFDFLLVLNFDDGLSKRQIYNSSGSVPEDLINELKCLYKANRIVTQVTFKTSVSNGSEKSNYFLRGATVDGSNDHFYSNYEKIGSGLAVYSSPRLVTFFGNNPSSATVIFGENGSTFYGYKNHELKSRISRVWKSRGKVHSIRVFDRHENYFIRDSLGYEYSGDCEAISVELQNDSSDPVVDIIMASNGAWIVIRSRSFTASRNVDPALTQSLSKFYSQQKIFIEQQEKAEVSPKAQESLSEAKAQRAEATTRKVLNEAERMIKVRREQEQMIQNKRLGHERLESLFYKRIKIGSQITVVGHSTSIGDTVVKAISSDGIVRARNFSPKGQTSLVIDDVSTIVSLSAMDEDVAMNHLVFVLQAQDEYEKAVAYMHNHGNLLTDPFNAIAVKDLLSAYVNNMNSDLAPVELLQDIALTPCKITAVADIASERMKHLIASAMLVPKKENVQVPCPTTNALKPTSNPVMFAPVFGDHCYRNDTFDEFKCCERIDIVRLRRFLLQFETNLKQESGLPIDLETKLVQNDEILQRLIRCYELEVVAREMLDVLSQYPVDEHGCVSYVVTYQYRDPNFRGHLFAAGKEVYTGSRKFPRTTTLQGIYKELRPTLVGAFAREIQCENSEIRTLCSLAEQLKLANLVKTFLSYRDKPKEYHDVIRRVHGVTEQQAMKLPLFILNGASYRQWLSTLKLEDNNKGCPDRAALDKFILGLQTEIGAVRDEIFKHPRFQWVLRDREKQLLSNQSCSSVDAANFFRIMQDCQNEVLGLIHRSFVNSRWIVRCKIFDKILIEKCPASPKDIAETSEAENLENRLFQIEKLCATFGWDVKLVETQLYGLQDQPIKILEEAIAIMNQKQIPASA